MISKNRPAVAGYKLCVCALSIFGTVFCFNTFGWNALRLFDTWILLVAAIYFFVEVGIVAFRKSRSPSRVLSPMIQGGIIINSIVLMILWIIYRLNMWSWPGVDDSMAILINLLLPVMFLLDWAIFSEKGRFGTYEPLNWLSFPIIFMSGMIISASFMIKGSDWQYPYQFLNYPAVGIEYLFWWTLITIVVYLGLGYILVVVDHLIGGRISQYIVMPRIKTIVIEEEIAVDDDNGGKSNIPAPRKKSKIEVIETLADEKSATNLHAKNTSVRVEPKRLDMTKAKPAATAKKQSSGPKPRSNQNGSKNVSNQKPHKANGTEAKPKPKKQQRDVTVTEAKAETIDSKNVTQ